MTLVFPDVAALALSQVADALGVPVGSRVPNPRPDTFVIARRVGGERITVVTEAELIAFECWAPTPADADDLAEDVRSLVYGWAPPGQLSGTVVDGVAIYAVQEVTGVADEPDAVSDQPRATFQLSIQVRGFPQEV